MMLKLVLKKQQKKPHYFGSGCCPWYLIFFLYGAYVFVLIVCVCLQGFLTDPCSKGRSVTTWVFIGFFPVED